MVREEATEEVEAEGQWGKVGEKPERRQDEQPPGQGCLGDHDSYLGPVPTCLISLTRGSHNGTHLTWIPPAVGTKEVTVNRKC